MWNEQNFPPPSSASRAPQPAPRKPALGGTLGVIAIALGVGLVAGYMLDAHGHTCDQCGNKWWHLGAFNFNDQPAHTCSKCSAVQWWKNGVPLAVREAHDLFGPNHG